MAETASCVGKLCSTGVSTQRSTSLQAQHAERLGLHVLSVLGL